MRELWLGTVLKSLKVVDCFFRFFEVGTHLSAGSADGLELFVESIVACNHVGDGSVAHFVLDVVAVKLVDSRKLIGSHG